MDQQAFRQLISTPRNDSPGQSSSSGSRYFGKQKKAVVKESPLCSADLVPRKVGAGSTKPSSSSLKEKVVAINSTTGESYIDRAEARRLGIDDTSGHSDAEALRREYEQRIDEAGDEGERKKLRNQMEHLIEDAKQSAITRGLDYELLEQEKAKLTGNIGGGLGDDDDLEEAYGSNSVADQSSETKETIKESIASKFKPIGSSAGFKAIGKEEEGQPEYIWRDGKRLRKKKKKKAAVEMGGEGESSASISTPRTESNGPSEKAKSIGEVSKQKAENGQLNAERRKQAIQKKNVKEREEMQPPQIIPPIITSPSASASSKVAEADQLSKGAEQGGVSSESDDDTTDIFADAGRWNGLDDDDDEEGEEGEAPVLAPVVEPTSSGKRDWFRTSKEEEEEKKEDAEEVALPSNLTNILDNAHEAKKTHEAAEDGLSDSEDEEGEVEAGSKSERLEGFSDSILGREGVRYMLEKKDDERDNQQRKRKRSKKGKGGYGSD